MRIEFPQGIAPDSWLQEERFADFRAGYSYAATQTAALPALAKCSAEEIYGVYEAIKSRECAALIQAARERDRLREKLEREMLDRLAEHHMLVNIEHWSGLEAINSIGVPAALEKINAEVLTSLHNQETDHE